MHHTEQGSSAASWTDLCNGRVLGRSCLLPAPAHVTWRLPVSLGPSFLALASRVALSVASTLRFLTTSPPTLLLQKHIAHRSRIVTIVFPSDFGLSIPKFLRIVVHTIAKMTQTEEEYDEAQAGDESMTGPGAPTPLAALEASLHDRHTLPGAFF